MKKVLTWIHEKIDQEGPENIALFIAAICFGFLFFPDIYQWLRSGQYDPITFKAYLLNHGGRGFVNWVIKPRDWFGLHKIVGGTLTYLFRVPGSLFPALGVYVAVFLILLIVKALCRLLLSIQESFLKI